jgi:hypothetical protein
MPLNELSFVQGLFVGLRGSLDANFQDAGAAWGACLGGQFRRLW